MSCQTLWTRRLGDSSRVAECLSASDKRLCPRLLVYNEIAPISASVMATKKSEQARTNALIVGVKQWYDGKFMTYDNGKKLPYYWYDDVPDHLMPKGDTPEEDYEIEMLNGGRRDLDVEATLDMSKIPESSLPSLPPTDEEIYTDMLSIGLPRMPEFEAELDMDQIDPELLK